MSDKTYKNFKLIAETNEPDFAKRVILAEITRVETTRGCAGNWFFEMTKDKITEETFQVIKCQDSTYFVEVATAKYVIAPKDFYFIYKSLEHLNKKELL